MAFCSKQYCTNNTDIKYIKAQKVIRNDGNSRGAPVCLGGRAYYSPMQESLTGMKFPG